MTKQSWQEHGPKTYPLRTARQESPGNRDYELDLISVVVGISIGTTGHYTTARGERDKQREQATSVCFVPVLGQIEASWAALVLLPHLRGEGLPLVDACPVTSPASRFISITGTSTCSKQTCHFRYLSDTIYFGRVLESRILSRLPRVVSTSSYLASSAVSEFSC